MSLHARAWLLVASTALLPRLALADPPAGQSALLNGMHDVESLAFMTGATPGCDKGWITDLRYIGAAGQPAADCHDAEIAAGVSIVQRLDVDGSHSFPLDPAQAPGYADAFASYAAQCPGIHVWIVGNEPNFTTNDSDPASYASPYGAAYAAVHPKLHAVPGHANDLVLVAPASPYSPFCICSMHKITQEIIVRGVEPDGYAVHAYTQAQHPSDFPGMTGLVASEDMSGSNDGCGYPFHWQFRIYRDWIGAIEQEGQGGKPVFITESGNACAPEQGNPCYPDQDLGYFHALYQELADWNADPSHATKVRAITPYRWTKNDDGTGRDFAIGDRPALQAELGGAFAQAHAWTSPKSCGVMPSACADDDGCQGSAICDLGAMSCASTTACGAGDACPAGQVCRAATADCVPSTRGAATILFTPSSPHPGDVVTIDVSAVPGYTNVGLDFRPIPGSALATTQTIQPGSPNHWIYKAKVDVAGTYRATFRADPGADTVYAIGYVDVGDIVSSSSSSSGGGASASSSGAAGGGSPSGSSGGGVGGDGAPGSAGCGCGVPAPRSRGVHAALALGALGLALLRVTRRRRS